MNTFLTLVALAGFLIIITFACGVNDDEVALQQDQIESAEIRAASTAQQAERTIHKIVDKLPLFGGCEDRDCSDQKLIAYVKENVKYPPEAKESGIEGRVFVQFVVEADGYVTDVKVVRGIGAGTAEEAISVVESFNEDGPAWSPGVLEGQEVAVLFLSLIHI